MPLTAVVSLIPPGAGRHYDVTTDESGGNAQTVTTRGGFGGNQVATQSNTGPGQGAIAVVGNSNLVALVLADGTNARMAQWQGSTAFQGFVSFFHAQPIIDFKWPTARVLMQCIARWGVTPGVNVDSGICFKSGGDHEQIISGREGIILGNRGGVLKLSTRGAGGFEEIDLSAFTTPTLQQLNKIALLLTFPTQRAPASISAIVNDVIAVTRTWTAGHKLPLVSAATGGFRPGINHGEAGTYFYTTQWGYKQAPDFGTTEI